VQRGVLQRLDEGAHDLVAVRLHRPLDGAANVPHETDGYDADLVGLGVAQPRYEKRLHRPHVLDEVPLEDVGNGRRRAQRLLVTRGVLRLQDLEEVGHDGVAPG